MEYHIAYRHKTPNKPKLKSIIQKKKKKKWSLLGYNKLKEIK